MTRLTKAYHWWLKQIRQTRGQEFGYLVLLAVPVGVICGYAALLLRFAIEWISLLWTGERTWVDALGSLPWWLYLLAPTVAGLLIGFVGFRLLGRSGLRGVPGVMADLVERKGHISVKQIGTETIGTAVAIGSGASLGREGPTVALGAAIASAIGERLNLNEQQLRILIGCGVAAGIAASFNTPIAGVLFALEVILADYTIATFSPIVISSVLATAISRAELGNFPAFFIPEYHLISAWEIPAYMGIGVVCGLVAMLLIKSLSPARQLYGQWIKEPRLRPAVAGLALGLLALAMPQVMSIGYHTVEALLMEQVQPQLFGMNVHVYTFLALLLAGKLLATILCTAGGFPGGLIGPTLFLGAVVGALFGGVMHGWVPAWSESYGAYALVACGALSAAALQAPITSMLMIFEMTADYHIMLPLMAACSVATLVKRLFGHESVFTELLEERGIEIEWGLEQSWLRAVSVRSIPWRSIPSISEHASLQELKKIYIESGKGCVQVVDDEGLMVGIVTFADLQEWLLDPELHEEVTAGDVANRKVRVVSEDGSLLEAIRTFDTEGFEQMPVVARDNPRKVLGVLPRNAVFSTYHRLIVKHGEGI